MFHIKVYLVDRICIVSIFQVHSSEFSRQKIVPHQENVSASQMIDIRITVLLSQLINCARTDTKNLIVFPSKLRLVGLNSCTHSSRKV